jgi:mono/diheme cytochrome c family protein
VAIPIPGTDEAPRVVFPDSSLPVISGLSAKLDGGEISVALPAPPPRPSDLVSDPEWFLSAKGIDSRASACRYYQAIGAVSACDGSGTPKEPKEGRVEKEAKEPEESRQPGKLQGAITFDDWKRATGLAPFGRGGATEVSATYVNRVDLGLTRNHHSVSYGPGQVAAYVCNHLGPLDGSKAAIDTAVDNAVHGRNLVACVGMDHGVTPGVNGDQPFTRFLIFGPSGELLPSVNLDGRREKFVPGVCVACHGGSKYAGRYPTSGPSRADIGAHFLPYDTGNFAFSTQVGLREVDQAAALKALNLNVLQTGPTPPTQELIAGWYADGGTLLDKDYLPTSWAPTSPVAQTFYREVYARSCRTCHVAFGETLNFDHFDNLAFTAHPDGNGALGERGSLRTAISACSGFSASFVRNFSMPNSLTTFNLFWGSAGQAVDQPALMAAFLQEQGELGPGEVCSLHAEPVP